MYLVSKNNYKRGYISLSRLMSVEHIDNSIKSELKRMLMDKPVLIGDLVIEVIEVDERV